MKNSIFKPLAFAGTILALGLSSCGGNEADKQLTGAGATFPFPLYSKMFNEYGKTSGMQTNYQSVGSGGGIKQITNKLVNFGASDAYLTDAEIAAMPAPVVEFPTCLGADVISYNLPGNPELKMTSDIIAGIFMKKITKWNDTMIAAANPGVTLPDMEISVVHRTDGSGTTFIFTDYLSKISPEWKSKIGAGKAVNWPEGELGQKGNEGVAGTIKQTPGTVGYIELAYAMQNNMAYAQVKNASGNYVKPSIETTSNCADMDIPDDTRITITNSPAAQGYPICSFTWIILYKEQKSDKTSKEKATNLVNELWWMIHDGQKLTGPLNYAPLPPKAVAKAEAVLKSVTYDGQPVLQQ